VISTFRVQPANVDDAAIFHDGSVASCPRRSAFWRECNCDVNAQRRGNTQHSLPFSKVTGEYLRPRHSPARLQAPWFLGIATSEETVMMLFAANFIACR